MTYWDALGETLGGVGPAMMWASMFIVAGLWIIGNAILFAALDELFEFWEYLTWLVILVAWSVGGGILAYAYWVWGTTVLGV